MTSSHGSATGDLRMRKQGKEKEAPNLPLSYSFMYVVGYFLYFIVVRLSFKYKSWIINHL